MYVDVVLPLALNKVFTYSVPHHLQSDVAFGKRALVNFKSGKIYAALIINAHNNKPLTYDAKDVLDIIDVTPVITQYQWQLWQWMAGYYLCTLGEVMAAALPASLKLESESIVQLHIDFVETQHILAQREFVLIEALHQKSSLTMHEVSKLVGVKIAHRLLQQMVEKKMIVISETILKQTPIKTITQVVLHSRCEDENTMREVFATLEKKSPKQFDLLLHYFNLTSGTATKYVSKAKLLKVSGSTPAILAQLNKKNILISYNLEAHQIPVTANTTQHLPSLSSLQQNALHQISETHTTKNVVLLHGVTSSGKTEIYIQLIHEQLLKGKQVLYLLPEIALTTQMILRLKKRFGDQVLVYHSKYSDSERLVTWNTLLNQQTPYIVVGARSAVFLPFTNLGLVIVDEEHESAYKQYQPAPRYHARDAAIILASHYNAKTLLGTATPALETYYNAQQKKFGLVTLHQRYANIELPQVHVIDLKEAYRRKQMKLNLSNVLIDAMQNALLQNEQIILFQNRRGFATLMECKTCGWVPQCINCDVSLTYHKSHNNLQCHYCGFHQQLPSVCRACGNTTLQLRGLGTQRVEEDLAQLFPDKRVARLDLDIARSKNAYHQIITDFENRATDILVGTQMITKGLDFENVSTVGIINADALFNYPDYRSNERSYQLMSQVAGRSGRKHKQGHVYIQTYTPLHPVLQFVKQHDYEAFYKYELAERLKFSFTPFFKIIQIEVRCKNELLLQRAAELFTHYLRKTFGNRVQGPVQPDVARINLYYINSIMLKVEKEASLNQTKKMLQQVTEMFYKHVEFVSVKIIADVDPV